MDLDESEENFEPLRKKLKRETTGKEDNFMPSYYQQTTRISQLTRHQIDQIMWNNHIEVHFSFPLLGANFWKDARR